MRWPASQPRRDAAHDLVAAGRGLVRNMDLRRLRLGEWLAAAGGVALLLDLTQGWYSGPPREADLSAFDAFGVIDVVLTLIAGLAITLAILQATRDSPALPVAAGVLTVVFGALAVVVVAYRLVDQPGPNELVEVRYGAWIGLAATLAITAGGWESLRNERVRHMPSGPEPKLRATPSPDS
jgi:hypothetical protein